MRRIGPADAEQRRLGEVDLPLFEQLRHEPEQQGQQQGADVGAVDVGVGHQDDLVVAQLVDVELVLHAGAERIDDRLDLPVLQDLVQPGLLDVQDLAADRQDRLGARVSSTLGRATGGVALDDEDLALERVVGRAVGQLAGQRSTSEQALAVACHLTRLAGGDAGGGGGLRLADDVLALDGVFLEPVGELVVDDALDEALCLGVAELGLGLALELGLGEHDRDDRGQALADVVAGDTVFALLDHAPGLAPLVDRVGQRGAEALLVGATFDGVDRVGEGVHRGGVGGVPLQRDLDAHPLLGQVGLDVDHGRVDRLAGAVDELHVVDQAVVVPERVVQLVALGVDVLGTFVGEGELEALVEEGHLAESGGQGLVGVVGGLEDLLRGPEGDLGAGLVGGLELLEVVLGDTQVEGLLPAVAVALDLDAELLRQRVHDRRADAVQAAGDLVAAVAKLAAGVQHGQGDGDGWLLLGGVHLHRETTPVVLHGDTAVGEDLHVDPVAVAGQCLVDGVVDDLPEAVHEPGRTVRADVHAGTLADGLKALEHLDLAGIVGTLGDRTVGGGLQALKAFGVPLVEDGVELVVGVLSDDGVAHRLRSLVDRGLGRCPTSRILPQSTGSPQPGGVSRAHEYPSKPRGGLVDGPVGPDPWSPSGPGPSEPL